MLEELMPWAPDARVARTVRLDDLTITFKRTIRVPDNDENTALPPDLGSFPLFKVDDYAENLPDKMARKGGLFLPMYQREALWINFRSKRRYVIKIHVGGINAVSGEPSVPNAATALRRRNLLKKGRSLQDYIVVPDQLWLDGIAIEPGNVRQFVAMPVGTGHSIESQMTGEERTAGIQFEITQLLPPALPASPGEKIEFTVQTWEQHFKCKVRSGTTIDALKDLIETYKGIQAENQLLVYDGHQLCGSQTLSDYNIVNNSVIELYLNQCGGGGPAPTELSIAAGGRITQGILPLDQREYRKTVSATFNVQILDSATFEQVTGKKPPKSPVTAKTYADCGYPFFSMWEEPTTVSGDFSKIQSVAQIDRDPDQPMPGIPIVDVATGNVVPSSLNWTCDVCGQINNTAVNECEDCLEGRPRTAVPGKVGLFNPRGPSAPLQLAWEMAEEVGQMHTAF
ncbi:hypothetical protein DER45DRAFT_631939 [Fusarium avenaceum]|nr:hypothetical protein DER45DRAFT_631939 [Fusarium avenaceum]